MEKKTYKAVSFGKNGAIMNTETKKVHSTWPTQREAGLVASDLNRFVKEEEFLRKRSILSNSAVAKRTA